MGWGEIELRHDAEYYRPAHIRLLASMHASGWPVLPLRRLSSHIVDGPFGSAIKADDYVERGVPFIRVADVTRGNGTIRLDQMKFISEEAHHLIRRSATQPGDVVVAKTGATMGAASIVPPSLPVANIRGDLALVGQLENDLQAQYLEAYFNSAIGYKLFWRLNSGSTRGRVVISNLKRYPVIWPDDNTKQLVVDRLRTARSSAAALRAEAAELLTSTDGLLLAKLGIDQPSEPDNTLANRTSLVHAHSVIGSRFDPFYHQPRFKRQMEALERSPFPKVPLRKISPTVVGGATPTRGDETLYCESGVKFLRIMNVRPNRIVLDDVKYIHDHVHEGELRRSQLAAGDILMTITGRVGTSAVVPLDILPANINQHIVRLRATRSDVLPEYVVLYLNSSVGLALSNRGVTGGTRIALDYGTVRALPIPLPDLEQQQRIVREIHDLQDRARDLEMQADAELESAKLTIEAILLGGPV